VVEHRDDYARNAHRKVTRRDAAGVASGRSDRSLRRCEVRSAIRELAVTATLLPLYVGFRGSARVLGAVENVMLR
jgi:hypothetical protein